jgi:hypothetical protein
MTAEIKLKTPGSQAERIHKREENSGAGAHPNVTTQTNKGWHHNIWLMGHEVLPGTQARECDPQSQRYHDEATQQTTTYFRGHGKHEQEGDEHD